MRWLRYARTEVAESVRDRTLYSIAGVFALIGAGMGYLYGGSPTGSGLAGTLLLPMYLFAPIAALTTGYGVIVEKRVSGSLKLVLGLPYSRGDVLVGGFLGRSAVAVASLTALFVAGTLVAVARGSGVDVVALGLAFVVVVCFTVVLSALATGISASTASTTRAGGMAFLTFVLLYVLWSVIPQAALYVLARLGHTIRNPEWLVAWNRLNPLVAFQTLAVAALSEMESFLGVGIPTDAAFYETSAFAVVVLVVWGVGALLGGYARFAQADL